MRKNKIRKGLVVAIIVLFVGVSVVPSAGMVEISTIGRAIFYVGGDGPGNYTTIQSAIDNTSDGDTVFVYDDSSPYYEHVVVDKSINLIGEDRDTTIIDGNKLDLFAVKISADWVNISEFTIRNGDEWLDTGILMCSRFSNIKDNIISNIYYGIILVLSSSNTISDNIITSNHNGIEIGWSHDNTITGNNISNNLGNGIYIVGDSNSNTVSDNFISNNEYGIYLDFSCNGNYILRNNIINNVRHAYFKDCWKNIWRQNYWNRPRILPVPIIGLGRTGTYPELPILWVNFDWRPALKPYDIEV